MRFGIAACAAAILITGASPSFAQDRLRASVNLGAHITDTPFTQTLTFQQYFEEATVTLDRTIPKAVFYDVGGSLRLYSGFHAGATVSTFQSDGSSSATASVPHPLFFNQPRSTTGDVPDINRRELATHIQLGWLFPAAGGLEFMGFAGPTIFRTEQVFVTQLNLTLANEVFPYDTLAFPGVATETITDTVIGYNVGVDMTWRFSKVFGAGAIIRYAHGTKDFTPTGAQATKVDVGGLQAGGGLRVIF